MNRLVPLVIRAWMLPVIVAAIAVPIIGGFFLVGPSLGLALGALAVAALLVTAARMQFDAPIEVAVAADRRYRVLVVATEPVAEPALIAQIAAIAADGQAVVDAAAVPQLLVLAPALQSTLDRWASDLDSARSEARRVVAISLGAFGAAELDAVGKVGDGDPIQAIEDELHLFAAREVVVLEGPGLGSAEVAEVRRRLDRPVRQLG